MNDNLIEHAIMFKMLQIYIEIDVQLSKIMTGYYSVILLNARSYTLCSSENHE